MKLALTTICFSLLLLTSFSCSTSNQNQNVNNASSKNTQSINSNLPPPVNLNDPKERKNVDRLIEELNKNREIWKSQNISDYNYYCEVFTGGTTVYNPVSVQVRENKTFLVEETAISGFHYQFNYQELDSIEKMFDYIQKHLEKGSSLSVKYNKKYGYPEDWTVKFGFNIHDYYVFKITKFEMIK